MRIKCVIRTQENTLIVAFNGLVDFPSAQVYAPQIIVGIGNY